MITIPTAMRSAMPNASATHSAAQCPTQCTYVEDVLRTFLTVGAEVTDPNAHEKTPRNSLVDYWTELRRREWAAILVALHATPTRERHPRVRTGPRTEIPAHVRVAVYLRDRRRCVICRATLHGQTKHLDHVHPWSAYNSSDRSHNLRTTCPPCNQARSNYDDGARPVTPCTWWCIDCWRYEQQRVAAWTNQYGPDGWRENAHPPIEVEHVDLVLAFCAFCRLESYTTNDRLI